MWPMWQAVFWMGLLFITILSVTGFKAVRDQRFLEPGAPPAPEQKELLLAEGEGRLRLRFRPRLSPLDLAGLLVFPVGAGVLSWLGGIPPLGIAGLVTVVMIFVARGALEALEEERWTVLELTQGIVEGPKGKWAELSRFSRLRLKTVYGYKSIRWQVSLVGDADIPIFE